MLRYLLLLGVILDTQATNQCFKDLKTYQCSCIDQKGYTPFWSDHFKQEEYGNWSATISLSDEKCTEDDAIGFIRHDNKSSGSNPGGKPSIEDMVSRGYVRNGDSLYKLHTKATYWDNARRICLSEAAHLAIPNTEEELQFLTSLIKSAEESAFVGVHDIFNEGERLTIFGEPISIASPKFEDVLDRRNTMTISLSGEDCIAISVAGIPYDVTCTHNFIFLCELELVQYPPDREIDYNNGPYKGVESSKGPSRGTVERIAPSTGYEYFPGFGFYRFHTIGQVWDVARHTCEMEDAHLVIINSIYEHNILKQFFDKVPPRRFPESDNEDRAFIGFHDLFEEGRYITIHNQTLEEAGYSQWFEAGQPDNEKRFDYDSGQNCGAMVRTGGIDDVGCSSFLSYFCEQDLYQIE